MAFYTYQLVSTMERLDGQTLLAEEISALSYWLTIDREAKGYMNLKSFVSLLRVSVRVNSDRALEKTLLRNL